MDLEGKNLISVLLYESKNMFEEDTEYSFTKDQPLIPKRSNM